MTVGQHVPSPSSLDVNSERLIKTWLTNFVAKGLTSLEFSIRKRKNIFDIEKRFDVENRELRYKIVIISLMRT